jgi:glycerate kinase
MTDEQQSTVTIDGAAYTMADLSENAKSQVVNLRVTDAEIEKLKQQLAIYQTARTAYASALRAELPENAKR